MAEAEPLEAEPKAVRATPIETLSDRLQTKKQEVTLDGSKLKLEPQNVGDALDEKSFGLKAVGKPAAMDAKTNVDVVIDKKMEAALQLDAKSLLARSAETKLDAKMDMKLAVQADPTADANSDFRPDLKTGLKIDVKFDGGNIRLGETSLQMNANGSFQSSQQGQSGQQGQQGQQAFSQRLQNMTQSRGSNAADTLDMMRKDWEERLVSRIERDLASGKQDIELILNPKSLGKMRVTMRMSEDGVNLKINSETGIAANLLGESEERLNEMFEAAGMRLAQFQSSWSGNRDFGGGQGSRNNSEIQSTKSSSPSVIKNDLVHSAQNMQSNGINLTA